eukprot:COSAG02_NODE_7591_length_2944_cov_1.834095_6_plen_107_part_00
MAVPCSLLQPLYIFVQATCPRPLLVELVFHCAQSCTHIFAQRFNWISTCGISRRACRRTMDRSGSQADSGGGLGGVHGAQLLARLMRGLALSTSILLVCVLWLVAS